MLLSETSLSTNQLSAIDRISTRRSTILIAPTGAGKTVMCLTAIKRVIDAGKIKRVIVAAPAKVVENNVWGKEAAKWEHLDKSMVVSLGGTSTERLHKLNHFNRGVIVVSLNNLDWLLNQGHGADGIIVDELSKASGKQAKGLNTKSKGGMFKWRIGMTATPVSQDYIKLFAMAKLVDGGKALGTAKHNYLNKYFYSDYMGYKWTLKADGAERIMEKINKLVHMVEDTKDADLPAVHQHVIEFDMPASTREHYDMMKKHMVTVDREAANEAVKSGVLRQISSGFVYLENDDTLTYDWARYDAVRQWLKNLGRRRGVVFYEFKAQGQILNDLSRFTDDIQDFISGDKDLLAAQINSLSHGVDGLQDVCSDMLFYHPMWSNDATQQAIGRLHRTGQEQEVNVTTLVCTDTLDSLVMERVEDRGEWMKLFKKHLKG